jgi:hypothetical protein
MKNWRALLHPKPLKRRWWSSWLDPVRLSPGGWRANRRVMFAFALMAVGLTVTLVPARFDEKALGELSADGMGFVPTLCFFVAAMCLAAGVWATVVAVQGRPLERLKLAGLGIAVAALCGHCARVAFQVLLLRDFYRPTLFFTSSARAAAVGWGSLLAVTLCIGLLAPVLVAVSNLILLAGGFHERGQAPSERVLDRRRWKGMPLPAVMLTAAATAAAQGVLSVRSCGKVVRWLAGRRWWLVLPFAALALTAIITEWILPASLAAAMGYTDPAPYGVQVTISLRELGPVAWDSLQLLVALPLLVEMWAGVEAARTCQRLVRTPKGADTALMVHARRIDYRLAAAVFVLPAVALAAATRSLLAMLAGTALLWTVALPISGRKLGQFSRLTAGVERATSRWELPEEWHSLGPVSLVIIVLALPVISLLGGDIFHGLEEAARLPADIMSFFNYWRGYGIITTPVLTVSGVYGHAESMVWGPSLIIAVLVFLGIVFGEGRHDWAGARKFSWLMLRVSIFALVLIPVTRLADHSFSTFLLAGCAIIAFSVTLKRESLPAAVGSAVVMGVALSGWSLLLWHTTWVPPATVVAFTILQRFVFNAGPDLNEGEHKANHVAYFQALGLLSVAMLAVEHGAPSGYFETDALSTVADRVALSVVAVIWLVLLAAQDRKKPPAAHDASTPTTAASTPESPTSVPIRATLMTESVPAARTGRTAEPLAADNHTAGALPRRPCRATNESENRGRIADSGPSKPLVPDL